MTTPTLRSAIRTGMLFGLLFSTVWISISQLNLLLPSSSPTAIWLNLSWISLLAGSIWGAFLWFNYRHRELPGRFLYHLFVGLGLTFTAAFLISLWSYASVTILPMLFDDLSRLLFHQSLPTAASTAVPAGKYALTNYSLVFFMAFVQTLFLSTVSCIRECVTG